VSSRNSRNTSASEVADESETERMLVQLEEDGILRRERGTRRTTRRWQSAMARAALRLLSVAEHEKSDLRAPIALAFLDFYGDEIDDEALASLVELVLPIEARELDPRVYLQGEAEE
jgi:hypothetical protein